MADRQSWSMARIASRRPLPKERALHPNTVGLIANRAAVDACRGCGYTVCDCARRMELKRKQESINSAGGRKKLDLDAATKAFLQQARSMGASPDSAAVKSAIDKTLQQEGKLGPRFPTRQEIDRECTALTPEQRGTLNVRCAEGLARHLNGYSNGRHRVRMLETSNGFYKGESLEVLEIKSIASGLVSVLEPITRRRGVVKASTVTW